jgi:hypothetical protein
MGYVFRLEWKKNIRAMAEWTFLYVDFALDDIVRQAVSNRNHGAVPLIWMDITIHQGQG